MLLLFWILREGVPSSFSVLGTSKYLHVILGSACLQAQLALLLGLSKNRRNPNEGPRTPDLPCFETCLAFPALGEWALPHSC